MVRITVDSVIIRIIDFCHSRSWVISIVAAIVISSSGSGSSIILMIPARLRLSWYWEHASGFRP